MTAFSHRFGLVVFQDAVIDTQIPADISIDFGGFHDTSATCAAISERGKVLLASMFGTGCTSIELPKSKADDFARFAEQNGLVWVGA